ARIGKLEAERARIQARLADPALYAPGQTHVVTEANQRLAAIAREVSAAEADWIAAEEALEAAG
ncbi:MAG: ABC transporter ATP-binding protein, partial [Gemmatimonadaceae bacterium]|nr:ABC transporter ATP-binding protein [Acetobacteraceae bacterium]